MSRPELQGFRRVWAEDDAAPDREPIGDAWPRLFGESFAEALDSSLCLDRGDAFVYLMPEGRAAVHDCGWWEIWAWAEDPPPPDLPRRGLPPLPSPAVE